MPTETLADRYDTTALAPETMAYNLDERADSTPDVEVFNQPVLDALRTCD